MDEKRFLFEEVLIDDPAGNVAEEELRSLTSNEDPAGGSAMLCVVVGGVIAASIALCPTTVCTSQCNKKALDQ